MGIPETQLQTWSHQGATVTAKNTHEAIRRALENYKWPEGVTYDAYLQGSYKNSTNIYGNSDVDLVVELTSAYWSNLTETEKIKMGWTSASYGWSDFRQDVISALVSFFGSAQVDTNGKKSIKVLPGNGRLKADVVVSGTYKLFENGRPRVQGITFWSLPTWEQIINFPKQHCDNGESKNSNYKTRGWYRQSTRMFKNARDKIIENDHSLKDKYPSYYIECLLYNVPDRCFGYSFGSTYTETVNWLNDKFNSNPVDGFVCQNEVYYLFGPGNVQWNKVDAGDLVKRLISLWNNW